MPKKLRWTDVQDIAIELEEAHPKADVVNLRFTDLWKWVQALPDFEDDPKKSNEKILEAIQAA
jgi:FeS assembly protein IscX